MSSPWLRFVDGALRGEPDDPFVRLLRQRLESGHEVVRVNLARTAKGVVYTVLLAHLRQLTPMEVPHSLGFTRWSLANGVRMASRDEEEQRWAELASERFQPIADDFGGDYAKLILLDRLRSAAPPRTVRALSQEVLTRTAPGREQARALREVDRFLRSLASDLGGALHYTVDEVADILDGALERFARQRFLLELRELWQTG